MKEKATIFDYARMCKHFDDNCQECPVFYKQTETGLGCEDFIRNCPDKANEIILKWCNEHPVKTRQDRFLKMFPNAKKDEEVINIDPCIVDETFYQASPCWECAKKRNVEDCEECRKNYWLAEVQE